MARASTQWIADALNDLKIPHNVRWRDEQGKLEVGEQSIATAGIGAEVIYAGGGNALILFAGGKENQVGAFTRIITTRGYARRAAWRSSLAASYLIGIALR